MTKIELILKTEYSTEFDELRKRMMVLGYYRYGAVLDNVLNEAYDIYGSLKRRLQKYEETKNVEYLADVANFCMIIFMFPEYFNAVYKPTDEDGSAGIEGMSINELRDFT